MSEEQQFRVEFVDGELRVYNEFDRMVVKQDKFPDGSNDPWTEEDALEWWEKVKLQYAKKVVMSHDDSTIENPEQGV